MATGILLIPNTPIPSLLVDSKVVTFKHDFPSGKKYNHMKETWIIYFHLFMTYIII